MKKTERMKRGIIAFLLIAIFLIFWIFFSQVYPAIVLMVLETLNFQLPKIDANIFLAIAGLIVVGMFVGWAIRNKLWLGLLFAMQYYSMVKRIRKHIKNARFEDEREIDNQIVDLPKIKIRFDDNKARKSGEVHIKNSVKFDKKLEDMRLDSALKNYIVERSYLSDDRNWYVYEFCSLDLLEQIEIKSEDDYISWTKETANDYELRLDVRTTLPIHHIALSGQTGSGKSFFIQMLIKQVLAKKTKHELFVIDPKSTDVYFLSKRTLGLERTANGEGAIELIKAFYEKFKERTDELQSYFELEKHRNKTYQDLGFPALILLIDEFGSLKASWESLPKKERDEVNNMLYEMTLKGRQLGCLVWFATQQMNVNIVKSEIREQLVLKIVLGDSGEQTYRTLFDSGVKIPPVNYTAGKGLYSYPGKVSDTKAKLLVVPFCSFLKGNT